MCYEHVLHTWTCTTFTNIDKKYKSKCTLLTQADRQHTNTHKLLYIQQITHTKQKH